MAKQTKSQRIRVLLAQGKSVKEIAKAVKCNPGLVYQVKAYDKKKEVKAKVKKAREDVAVRKMKDYENAWNAATSQQPIRVPNGILQPRDYYQPKPSLFQRVKNFFLGC